MSLKVKLFGAIFLVILVSCLSFVYGIYGSKAIIDATDTVRQDAYPVLNVSNELNHIIHNTNAAIMSAIDGDEEFEKYIQKEYQHFKTLLEKIDPKEQEKPKVMNLLFQYEKYIARGIIFGKSELNNTGELGEDIQQLSNMKLKLTQLIQEYRETNQKLFESSLNSINKRSHHFRAIFLTVGLSLVMLLVIMGIIIRKLLHAIITLEKQAQNLGQGHLNQPIPCTRNDEIGVLQMSFETMRVSLMDHIDNLDLKVRERTEALEIAKKEIEDILSNMDQGIFTFSLDLITFPQHSAKATELFSIDNFKNTPLQNILHMSEESAKLFRSWVNLFRDPKKLKRWKKYLNLNPVQTLEIENEQGTIIIDLNYQPIIENGELKRIMVLGYDITARTKAEKTAKANAAERELQHQTVSALVSYQREELQSCIQDLQQFECSVRDLPFEQIRIEKLEFFRVCHTLKGWCGTYGLKRVEEAFHHLESCLSDAPHEDDGEIERKQLWESSVRELQINIHALQQYYDLIYKQKTEGITVHRQSYEKLLELAPNLPEDSSIREHIEQLNSIPLKSICKKYDRIIEQQALKSGKKIAPLTFDHGELPIHRNHANVLDKAMIHIIKNAIVHGIESQDIRNELGKDEGKIQIKSQHEKEYIAVSIIDDGAGLDIQKVRERAIIKGLIDENDEWSTERAIATICHPNFSTQSSSDLMSGRGLGLDIVKQVIEHHQGTLSIQSQPNKGTTITIRLPHH